VEYWQQVDRLRVKVERAEHHIRDLQEQWRKFTPNAYPVKTKDDPKTRECVWYLAGAWDVPDSLSAIVGDAAHNLRSALDHLAYYLVGVATRNAGPFDGIYFPIGSSPTDFAEKLDRAKECKTSAKGIVKRLRPDAIKAIQALEPYDRGRGAILFRLHKLDIIDKHRFLLTVGGRNPTHTMSPSDIASYKRGLGIKNGEFTSSQEAMVFQTESVSHFPLKAGDELARRPIPEADQEMYFPFVIAFGEPRVLEGKPVIPSLQEMADFIRGMIRSFDRDGILR
jgi:hypothetical protein